MVLLFALMPFTVCHSNPWSMAAFLARFYNSRFLNSSLGHLIEVNLFLHDSTAAMLLVTQNAFTLKQASYMEV